MNQQHASTISGLGYLAQMFPHFWCFGKSSIFCFKYWGGGGVRRGASREVGEVWQLGPVSPNLIWEKNKTECRILWPCLRRSHDCTTAVVILWDSLLSDLPKNLFETTVRAKQETAPSPSSGDECLKDKQNDAKVESGKIWTKETNSAR